MHIFKFFSSTDTLKHNLNTYPISHNKVDPFAIRVVLHKLDKLCLVLGVKYVPISFNTSNTWSGLKKILRSLKEKNILFFVEEFIKV